MMGIKTTKDFIRESKKIHNDMYDYSKVIYKNEKTKVLIICKKHGEFLQYPRNHVNGANCMLCNNEHSWDKRIDQKALEFLVRAKQIHKDKYDYSLVKYCRSTDRVIIICPVHGQFLQTPNRHIRDGNGCRKCSWIQGGINHRIKHSEFIDRAQKVHGSKYDYSLAKYEGNIKKVRIICEKHGVFEQTPDTHCAGGGCPQCRNSHGENKISLLLKENKITFIREKTFPLCRINKPMRFDFFLPDYNLLMEYHGLLHFITRKETTGLDKLMATKMRDEYKERWAMEKGFIFKKYTCYDDWRYIFKDILKIISK